MLEVKMYDDVEFRKRNEKFGHKKIEFIEIEMDPGNWSFHGPWTLGHERMTLRDDSRSITGIEHLIEHVFYCKLAMTPMTFVTLLTRV